MFFNTATLRLAIGLIILHRSISIYGAATAHSKEEIAAIILSIFSLSLTFGFLTPITAILTGAVNLLLVSNLSPQIVMIACIYIAIAKGGELFSMDNRLRKTLKVYNLFLLKIESLFPSPAIARTVTIILFAGVSWSAMLFHFKDPLWLNGEVLQFLFTNAYISDTSQIFEEIQSNYPFVVSLLLKITIYIQGFFELFSWFFIGTLSGRWFIALWGIGFFITSHFLMNLMYLPILEIFLWIALFNFRDTLSWMKPIQIVYDDKCGVCAKTIKFISYLDYFENFKFCGFSEINKINHQEIGKTQSVINPNDFWAIESRTGRLYKNFDAYVLIILNSFMWPLYPVSLVLKYSRIGDFFWSIIARRRYAISVACNLSNSIEREHTSSVNQPHKKNISQNIIWILGAAIITITFNVYAFFYIYTGFRITGISKILTGVVWKFTGQGFVNVFNKTDLNMNQYSLIMCRKDDKFLNTQTSLVPFQDLNGGRLAYLANDLIYYRRSIIFQRKTINMDISYAAKEGKSLSLFIAKLDNSITNNKGYNVYLLKRFSQSLNGSSFPNSWGESEIIKEWTINIGNEENTKDRFLLGPSYHILQKSRYKKTNDKYCR